MSLGIKLRGINPGDEKCNHFRIIFASEESNTFYFFINGK